MHMAASNAKTMKLVLKPQPERVESVAKMPLNYAGDGDNISNRFKERFIIIIDVMSMPRCHGLCGPIYSSAIYGTCVILDSSGVNSSPDGESRHDNDDDDENR